MYFENAWNIIKYSPKLLWKVGSRSSSVTVSPGHCHYDHQVTLAEVSVHYHHHWLETYGSTAIDRHILTLDQSKQSYQWPDQSPPASLRPHVSSSRCVICPATNSSSASSVNAQSDGETKHSNNKQIFYVSVKLCLLVNSPHTRSSVAPGYGLCPI